MSTLSSIYHKTPEELAIMQRKTPATPLVKQESKKDEEGEEGEAESN
jgi:hypothetical protein